MNQQKGTILRKILIDAIKKDSIGPREKEEEFVNFERPQSRYFSGVLYPKRTPLDESDDIVEGDTQISSNENEENGDSANKTALKFDTRPSSMGLTCYLLPGTKSIDVKVKYGIYHGTDDEKKDDKVKNNSNTKKKKEEPKQQEVKTGRERYEKWIREEINETKSIELVDTGEEFSSLKVKDDCYVKYQIKVLNDKISLSIFLTNEKESVEGEFTQDFDCIFHPEMELSSPNSEKIFLNFTKIEKKSLPPDPEDRITTFLFRNESNFAQGHNCSVEWDQDDKDNKRSWVRTTFFPTYTVPEIKPREPTEEIKKLLDMRNLYEVQDSSKYKEILEPLVEKYSDWINDLTKEKKNIESIFVDDFDIPQHQIDNCLDAKKRIRKGIQIISENVDAAEAFRFANEAMYLQRIYSQWAQGNRERRGKVLRDEPETDNPKDRPSWRLFQLAFILLNIESIYNPKSLDRNTVDLLWFPTGGGKTEAYFGIIAFTMALRRLLKKDAKTLEEEFARYGVTVIMRYTYRLLTLQQFQRASALMCACERIRLRVELNGKSENRKKFGNSPFLVGLWVGRATTPNDFGEAAKRIYWMQKGGEYESENPVILLSCPSCGRKLNAHNYGKAVRKKKQDGTEGDSFEFEEQKPSNNNPKDFRPKRVRIKCHKDCFFGIPGDNDRYLPVVFIDDDIRNFCPSLLISTVDKFAQISWNYRYSSLFGKVGQYCTQDAFRPGNSANCNHNAVRWKDGTRSAFETETLPNGILQPELIIQDELHLISGPLGTLTGLYETAIYDLCKQGDIGPKIIASTATTKKSADQINHLFAKSETKIFPSQGYRFGDSFFAEILPVSVKNPGKIYAGICATSVGGYTIDARIAATILRKIRQIREMKSKYNFEGKDYSFSDDDLDPYYTLVEYYNTIKNLGASVRMYEDSIPDFIKTIVNRYEKTKPEQDTNLTVKELTGRISHFEVPKTLEEVGKKLDSKNDAIDALLCTNMLSVGVDIDRLSVLLVNGQPGSTSEYIQATGRVGRKHPGLVVTNYTYTKSRDLSYFENFLQFHTTFHKEVEPGTLTPFSSRARDRGLFGVFVALIRLESRYLAENNSASRFQRSDPTVSRLVDDIKSKILARVELLDPSEKQETEKQLDSFVNRWDRLSTRHHAGEIKLKYRASLYQRRDKPKNEIYLLNSSRDYDPQGFVIPESLREAESEVDTYYIRDLGPSGAYNG